LVKPILLALLLPMTSLPLPAFSTEAIAIGDGTLSLKVPDRPAPGKPWLWVGEFAGHLQSLEDRLVARGWHVAYVNVSNQFGSPRAMGTWEKVYAELHGRRGLSARPALLGISRGGLYVTAWLRLHPDRASVLYLDNAVGDIRSWPGGYPLNARVAGSPGDWALFMAEFGYASDQEAVTKSPRPADGLAPAIAAGVFLISVHGTADTIVPYVDNTAPIVALWASTGGRYKLFPKPGGDHHPHGLPDPAPLIKLLCAEVK
jgi:pimeloyl-ACP methyl ester carboxylesterase